MVELLNQHGAKYSHFDILTDNDVRQGSMHHTYLDQVIIIISSVYF